MTNEKVLRKANPNHHGTVRLIQIGEGADAVYLVSDPYNEDGVEFDGDLARAEAYFDETVKELSETPNWEAQARYDEEHGTDNGYASFQRREY